MPRFASRSSATSGSRQPNASDIGSSRPLAIGGTETTGSDGYKYHVLLSTLAFQILQGGTFEIVMCGGGGGGGCVAGGGGGGGGVIPLTAISLPSGTHRVAIGAGGAGSPYPGPPNASQAGGNTTAFGLIAYGGGAGSHNYTGGAVSAVGLAPTRGPLWTPGNGGSGGGVGSGGSTTTPGGFGLSGQGNNGGSPAASVQVGGGGGYSSAGRAVQAQSGGEGYALPAGFATAVGFIVIGSGGGGGRAVDDTTGSNGGTGAGAGYSYATGANATSPGSGGGGGGYRPMPTNVGFGGGNGAAGLVVVRYRLSAP